MNLNSKVLHWIFGSKKHEDHVREGGKIRVTGQCSDLLEEWDEENGIYVPVFARTQSNLVVDIAAEMFAGSVAGLKPGIQFHAVGTANPGGPVAGDTQLDTELFRKVPATISFVDENAGQAEAGTTTSLTDNDIAGNFPDDFFNNLRLIITGGTNAGEDRRIIDYIGASGQFITQATFPFSSAIDATSVYEVNVPVATVTNKFSVVTTFLAGEATGTLKEHGLFGIDATGTINSGTLFNLIRHPDIVKTATSQLTRAMRIKVEIA